MANKNLVKDVNNKGNMLVLLNLKQIRLIFKNYIRKFRNTLLC